MPQFGGASEKCVVCSKTVYLVEKIVVEDKEEKKTFHKGCLKCTHCNVKLSLGNYASMNGVMYCKPHFKQLFATKGNYDEGFGKEKHTTKWTPNAPPAASTAGSFVPVEKTDIEVKSPEKKDTPSSIASKFQKTSFISERCEKCSKTVYATEKIVVEDKEGKKVYHKGCLRCVHCQVVLTLGNYAAMNGITYCKPHFKQLFATKGNYDEGFGKEKHTTKWDPQSNAAPATFVPVEKTDAKADNKPNPPPSEAANKFKGISASGSDKCTACGKTVYLTEKTVVEDKEDKKVFHKACLRCSHCQVVLSLGNYASMGGVMYCKPHFKQLFASKGNYDEGFGKQKHTAKWLDQDEHGESPRSDASSTPREESVPVVQEHHHTPAAHHEEPKEQEQHHHHEEEKHKEPEPEPHHAEQHHSTVDDHHEHPAPSRRDDSSSSSDEDAKERRREAEELQRERERERDRDDDDRDHHRDRDSDRSDEDD